MIFMSCNETRAAATTEPIDRFSYSTILAGLSSNNLTAHEQDTNEPR